MIKSFLGLICGLFLSINLHGQIQPTQLTCEYVKDPSVVDVLQPRLAWINIAQEEDRGQKQSAYQVVVASKKELLRKPDLWDSRKVNSDQSTRIVYKGEKLRSRQDCWWQVRVWDRDGKASEWSNPAQWHMGLLDPAEWKAEWIGAPWQGEEALPKPSGPNGWPEEMPPPAPYLRKEFEIKKDISKAMAYVTGLGYFEFYVNGQKIGDDVLVPNQTNYGKRPDLKEENIPLEDNFREYKVMYLAYDITDEVHNGMNAVGGIVGNGFYNAAKYWAGSYGTPRFIAQIHVTYTDGAEDLIVSDLSWKASHSPILMIWSIMVNIMMPERSNPVGINPDMMIQGGKMSYPGKCLKENSWHIHLILTGSQKGSTRFPLRRIMMAGIWWISALKYPDGFESIR
jgi:alpha-L-rhamnosidase